MKRPFTRMITIIFCAVLLALTFSPIQSDGAVRAQGNSSARSSVSHCTNGTASGTYGYRMSGQILGLGPVLVNGLFTHDPNGTISGNVYINLNGVTIPNASWTNGTFTTNADCTGTGSFFVAALGQQITYNFIATDGGRQIDLLNTNAGNAFQGVGRRISQNGQGPSCTDGTIKGSYGYRLDGSLPGMQVIVGAGTLTHSQDENLNGITAGADTNGINGMFFPRTFEGTYKVNSDCTGAGRYTDSIGNTINYVFVTVDKGQEIYFQGTNPGEIVSGVGRRIK